MKTPELELWGFQVSNLNCFQLTMANRVFTVLIKTYYSAFHKVGLQACIYYVINIQGSHLYNYIYRVARLPFRQSP